MKVRLNLRNKEEDRNPNESTEKKDSKSKRESKEKKDKEYKTETKKKKDEGNRNQKNEMKVRTVRVRLMKTSQMKRRNAKAMLNQR